MFTTEQEALDSWMKELSVYVPLHCYSLENFYNYFVSGYSPETASELVKKART